MSYIDSFDELILLLENTKKIPFSKLVLVNEDKIDSLSYILKEQFPDEIKRSQKILNERNEIIEQAKTDAIKIIEDAKKERDRLVSEDEVYKKAVIDGKEMVSKAKEHTMYVLRELNSSISSILNIMGNDFVKIEEDIVGLKKRLQDELQQVKKRIVDE